MRKTRSFIVSLFLLGVGVAIGGYIFSGTLPRSFLTISDCKNSCFNTSQLTGLLSSVGINTLGGKLPHVVYETDKSIAFDIQYPYPPEVVHYVVVPKKDIQDFGQFSDEDASYLADAYAVMGKLARESGLSKYRVITNGPGYQEVAYLHFHLTMSKNK